MGLKAELSNYFDDVDEDIYDYIPPQNTNQIYTPKWVVQKMVFAGIMVMTGILFK